MIIRRSIWMAIFILFILFTGMFVSLMSIYEMPDRVLGGKDIYVLVSSTDKNPIRSNIDINFAYGIENLSYVQAVSPEIYAFTTINGKSTTIRGVMFKKFFNLQGGGIIDGSFPHTLFDALLGVNAQRMLNINIGDTVILRGSFTSSIAIVNITGIFKTNSPADDEILVSIPTAEKLAGIKPGTVSIIRIKTDAHDKIEKLLDPNTPKFMVNLNMTHMGFVHQTISLNATIKNVGENGGNCELLISFENSSKIIKLYVDKEKKVQFNLTLNQMGSQNLTATVKNDIFYYTCYTEISVFPRPVFAQGPSIAFPNTPVTYTFKTLNNQSIKNGTLLVKGEDFEREYHVQGSVNITYPSAGKYSLHFTGDDYENETLNVSVYERVNMSRIALIEPQPINGAIFVNSTEQIEVYTGGTVYYSIDGSAFAEGNIISIPKNMYGNHKLNLTVVSGKYMAIQRYILHVFSSYAPIIIPSQNTTKVLYGSTIKYILCDPAPIVNATLRVNGVNKKITINQVLNASVVNYTYTLYVKINQTPHIDMHLYFKDLWGRHTSYHTTYSVVVEGDIERPKIYVPSIVKIWGGNSTVVEVKDNVAVKNITVYVDWPYPQRIFKSTEINATLDISVPTCLNNSERIIYVNEGAYNATVVAYDVFGNKNQTNFTIVINNSGEKNPPMLIMNKSNNGYYNLTKGWIKFTAYDNVAVKWVGCYEKNGSSYVLVKEVYGNSETENLTLYLNSSYFSKGLHHLLVGSYDINYNFMNYIPITVLKNYTDTVKPEINVPNEVKIWGGNTTVLDVSDNVAVKNVSVYVNWTYPQKFFNSTGDKSILHIAIPTSFQEGGKIIYVVEGKYNATVVAYDVFGNRNETNFTIIVNNSGEKNPPRFTIGDYMAFGFLQNLTISAYDNVAVEKMWITNSTEVIEDNSGGSITLYGKLLKVGYNLLTVHAEDRNGNIASKNINVLITDDVKPWLVTTKVEIWGGNATIIKAEDNVQVSWISAYLNGIYYNASGNQVEIPTEFINDSSVNFLQEGNHPVLVKVSDPSGNINTTVFHIIINNREEKNPPVILGPEYGVVNISSPLIYFSFDNVAVKKMWISEGSKIIKEINGTTINITYCDLPSGEYYLTVYAEDVNGNVAKKNIGVSVVGIKEISIDVQLLKSKIKEDEQDVLKINLVNGNTMGYYNLTVFIDQEIYYNAEILLKPYERKVLSMELPILSAGNHTIRVGNETVYLEVLKKSSEKIPTDLILKYAKNMKFSESKNVIYKGFQISEGNFILLLLSLMVVTLILLFLGLYSSVLKGIKSQNIGILRAIGASDRQIFAYFTIDSIKYVFIPIIIGILGGYLLIIFINSLDLLTALGHRLIIVPTFMDIITIVGISLIFTTIALLIIFRSLIRKKVVHHILGTEESVATVRLEDVIGSE